MKKGGFILAGLGGLLVFALTRKQSPAPSAPSSIQKNPCDSPPPTKQPAMPAGFVGYRGTIDDIAQGVANNMLRANIGDTQAFTDGEGRQLLAFVSWHCKVSKGGWHKGVSLLERKA